MMPFYFDIKVYVEDTDYGGITYHPNYLKYMERARTEWLNSEGISLLELQAQQVLLVVRKAYLDFQNPAIINDILTVETSIERIKNTRLIFKHCIVKKDTPSIICCTGEVEVVCINHDKRPTRLPHLILEKLS